MRRILAILLLCVFGFPIATPLFAAEADQDAGLPACCRRTGTHHCFMNVAHTSERSQGTRLAVQHEKCPAYPAATTSIRQNEASLPPSSLLLSNYPARAIDDLPLGVRTPSAVDQSRHERGPPTLHS